MSDFKWRHFAGDIILQCVRWYCKYGISYRELEEMMEERGICVDHTTLYRWVQTYAPEIEKRLRSGLSHMALALERGRCGGGDIAGVLGIRSSAEAALWKNSSLALPKSWTHDRTMPATIYMNCC